MILKYNFFFSFAGMDDKSDAIDAFTCIAYDYKGSLSSDALVPKSFDFDPDSCTTNGHTGAVNDTTDGDAPRYNALKSVLEFGE